MKRTTIIIIALFVVCYIAFMTCVAFESRNVIPIEYVTVTDTADVDFVEIPLTDAENLSLGIDNENQQIFGGLTGELRIVAGDTISRNRLVVPQQLKQYFTEKVNDKNVSIVVGDSANSPMVIQCAVPVTLYYKRLPSEIENYLTSSFRIVGGTADSLKVTIIRELELSAITAGTVTINSRYRYNYGQGNCIIRVTDNALIDTLNIGNQFHNANVATDSLTSVRNFVMLTPGKTTLTVSPESNIGNFNFPSEQGEKSLIIKSSESFEFSNKNNK